MRICGVGGEVRGRGRHSRAVICGVDAGEFDV